MSIEHIEFNLGDGNLAEAHLGSEFGSHDGLLLRRFEKIACSKCTDPRSIRLYADSLYPISKIFGSTISNNFTKKRLVMALRTGTTMVFSLFIDGF